MANERTLRITDCDFTDPARAYLAWLDAELAGDSRYASNGIHRRFTSGSVHLTPSLMVRVDSPPFDEKMPVGKGLIVVCNTGVETALTVSGRRIGRQGDTATENQALVLVERASRVGAVRATIITKDSTIFSRGPFGRRVLRSTFGEEQELLRTRTQVEDVFQRMREIVTTHRPVSFRRSRRS